jgi:putative nucleotide binding protein
MHSLELIPGIGKRLMFQIIEKREQMPFKSYDDIRKHVNISDPVKLITRRIILELKGKEKYNLFVRNRLV